MQQAVLLDADVDERAEVDHVAHGALQLEPGVEIVHGEHVAAQDGCGQIRTGIAAGAHQLLQHVGQGRLADTQLHGQLGPGAGREQGIECGLTRVQWRREVEAGQRQELPRRL